MLSSIPYSQSLSFKARPTVAITGAPMPVSQAINVGSEVSNGDGTFSRAPTVSITSTAATLNASGSTCRQSSCLLLRRVITRLSAELAKMTDGARTIDMVNGLNVGRLVLTHTNVPNGNAAPYPPTHAYHKVHVALSRMDLLLPILDALVANTVVLFDRDPRNVERRRRQRDSFGLSWKTVPRGIEWSGLSSIYLTSYEIWGLITGMARLAVLAVAYDDPTIPGRSYTKAINDAVSPAAIQRALDANDWDLAYANWTKLAPLVCEMTEGQDGNALPITRGTLRLFDHFVKRVKDRGLSYWFPSIKTSWGEHDPLGFGWEHWVATKVKEDMETVPKVVEAPVVARQGTNYAYASFTL